MLSRAYQDVPVGRKPSWLRVRAPGGEGYVRIKSVLRERGLHTVCEEARCPNVGECWAGGTATFMLLGDTCTRACGFCAVKTGNPRGAVDAAEPRKIAEAVEAMRLRYVVLTTVDRDDLADGGAAHFAATVRALKERRPDLLVEVLTGDFQGAPAPLGTVLAAGPDVFAHNLEVVERLTPAVRDRRAGYRRSLAVLASALEAAPRVVTKSSLMLGLGESRAEVLAAMRDLRRAGVSILTLGQYLRPTARHLPVAEYLPPQTFRELERIGLDLGFRYVAAGPLVRSSYKAAEHFLASMLRGSGSSGASRPAGAAPAKESA